MKDENKNSTKWKVEFVVKILEPRVFMVGFPLEETWRDWLWAIWRDSVLPAFIFALSFTFVFMGMRFIFGNMR